jgi:hypothetical protein
MRESKSTSRIELRDSASVDTRFRASVDVSTEGTRQTNYRYELLAEDRAKFDAALSAVARIKATFDDWVVIGHAVVAARKYAERVGGRQTFHSVLAEQQIMPPLDKAVISRLEKIMHRLDAVVKWRATLTEQQRIAWASPTSIVNRCTVFKIEKEQRRVVAPRKPTRLESAQEENRALKVEVERHRRPGKDYGFRNEDQATDIADLLTRTLSELKQRELMTELVRRLGTRKQQQAVPPAPKQNWPPFLRRRMHRARAREVRERSCGRIDGVADNRWSAGTLPTANHRSLFALTRRPIAEGGRRYRLPAGR